MPKFYILSKVYAPNTAVTNHALAFVHGFDELGIRAEWTFLLPDAKCSKITSDFNNITISYLWNRKFASNKVIKGLYKHFSYAHFFFSLKKGDVVLLLGMCDYLHFLLKKKGVKVYHERTEHPWGVRSCKNKFFERNYLKDCCQAEGLFVISSALKTYFESVGVESEKIHVINMVVDGKRFENIRKEQNTESYIAYCGTATNLKDGVDDLIRSFAIVAKQDSTINLYIIGAKPSKDSENYKLVESLCLTDRVVFTGIVPANQMPQLLVNAQIVALARPSTLQNKYGFPTKLGEYLLSGNPVVVTRVGDIPLFLKDKETAMLSDCHDVEAFANNIIWLLDHPDEAKLIGNQGCELARREFNYLTETKKMCNVMFKK